MQIKAIENTFLKKRPIQSVELNSAEKLEVKIGREYQIESYSESKNGHYLVKLAYDAGDWYIYSGHWQTLWEEEDEDDDEPPQELLSKENLRAIMPSANQSDIDLYVEPINKVLYRFNIMTGRRIAAFIAQVAHESGSLKHKEEIASGEAYEGRKDLVNIKPGDGKRFKGRGLIQLTGRGNYRAAGKALGLDLENNPHLATIDPYTNAAIAGWFWDSRDINIPADAGDFEKVTRLVNGGLNGYQNRVEYWEKAKRILGEQESPDIYPKSWLEIEWHNMSAAVSKYFLVREVTNGDRRRIPTEDSIKQNVFKLAQELDRLRQEWGSPILVTSWYRPKEINAAVGGVSNSQHLNGSAADIRPAQGNLYHFQDWLDKVAWQHWALGYGAKKGFVHVDLRAGGIRWNY
jgi:predicted chitinase